MHQGTTTTISLPRVLAERARRLSRVEGRTMSELFREAFRCYETAHHHTVIAGDIKWDQLRASLQRIRRAGKKVNLSAFIARDRQSH